MTAVPAAGPGWVRDAVFYQIFPDRFATSSRVAKPGPLEPWNAPPTSHGFKGGDLLGIAEHLDELSDLGVTALYLTPIFSSASNHRYHAYTYEEVDPLLGGDAALRELLDQAHKRGLRVILDGVFNHTGRGFWQFHHIVENGAQSPYRDWFNLDPTVLAGRCGVDPYPGPDRVAAMRRLAQSGAHVSPSQKVLGYQAWWDHPALPKLNHANAAVREHLYSVAERWLRFGIDGWRLDVPQEITEPGFWEEFRRRCLTVNPEMYLVGEIWHAAPEWLAGDRFHGLMNYPLTEAILSFVGGRRLDMALVAEADELGRHVHPVEGREFGDWLAAVMTTYDSAVTEHQLNLLDSHDTPRFISMAGGDAAALRLATLIQMTLPGAPCIYYGDEVGLGGREDPDCRRGYPWDLAKQDLGLRDFTAGLIALRHAQPALRRGRFELLAAEGSAVAYGMFGPESPSLAGPDPAYLAMIVVLNAGDTPAELSFAHSDLAGHMAERVSWKGNEWLTPFAQRPLERGTLVVEIGAREGVVLGVHPTL